MQHLLSWIIFTPLLGSFIILLIPKNNPAWIRGIALAATIAVGLLTLALFLRFDPRLTEMQFRESVSWIPQLNVSYSLGVDGISLPMIILTALISILACLASFGIENRVKEYFFLYLFLETGMLGTFLAVDLFLFYVFWEIVLVPMYFLIGIWGGPRKEYAAIKFFLYTLFGSLFMLLGILALYFRAAPHTFDWVALSQIEYSARFQKLVFLAFFLGFAIKVPIWPFHTWLPDAHVEAPTPISVILAGVLLKMGTYGFYRFSYPILPDAAQWFHPFMAVLALIGIIYGGFVALAQTDFKKMVAYSSVSHMGFVLLGLASMNSTGFSGGLLQMFTHGTITGGLFLLVGVLYDRSHSRDMNGFGGLSAQMPVYAGLLIFFSMASLGLPTLSGFVSEFLVLLGTFQAQKIVAMLACIGILLAAAYLLYMVRRVLLGPIAEKWKSLPDINALEVVTLVPLVIAILMVGLYPAPLLAIFKPAVEVLVSQVGGLNL